MGRTLVGRARSEQGLKATKEEEKRGGGVPGGEGGKRKAQLSRGHLASLR
jgi:hypothetical protein